MNITVRQDAIDALPIISNKCKCNKYPTHNEIQKDKHMEQSNGLSCLSLYAHLMR